MSMKLKIAILDSDTVFVNRLVKSFQQKYPDDMVLSLFTSEEKLYESLERSYVDIVLADSSVKLSKDRIPENTMIGYLSRVPNAEEINGIPAICKYQKVDILYKRILDLFAENSSNIKLREIGNIQTRIVLFTSCQGGCGTSSAAAAYALRCAGEKKRVFYLNLEKLGNTGLYFSGDGALSFSDIIYALKSKKSNLSLKIESVSRKDPSGVVFFNSCANAYDMFELRDSELGELLRELSGMNKYDVVVLDLSGDLTKRILFLMREYADSIVYLSDGSSTGNGKFQRFCEAVRVIEQREKVNLLGKVRLLYNRYSSKTGTQLDQAPVAVIGGIHRFEGMKEKELIHQLSNTEAIQQI